MRGAIHEWFGLAGPGGGDGGRDGRWSPPMCLLTHLAWQAVTEAADRSGATRYVVWIGRRLWPYPRVMLRGSLIVERSGNLLAPVTEESELLLKRSLFIDPPDDASRLWAIDLALRCPAVTAVIADGSRLRMAQTRRLQLASGEGGGGVLALLARPPAEIGELSTAVTRWRVQPAPSSSGHPRWRVELLRRKGGLGRWSRPAEEKRKRAEKKQCCREWLLEWDHVQGAVTACADVVHRPGASTTASVTRPDHTGVRHARRTA